MFKYTLESVNDHQYSISKEQQDSLYQYPINKLFSILTSYGFEARIVGGAIRDILLGKKPRDVDIVTNALPDQIIYLLNLSEIEVDTYGISHGTIKAVIDGDKYEITSLAYSIDFDKDGKPIVHSTQDWAQDAMRRDYTINALSMDVDGNLYDYGHGFNDLKNQTIRGLGEFEAKVKKDPNVILRAFKLMAKLDHPKMIKSTMDIIQKNAELVSSVAKDKVGKTLIDIIKSDNAKKVLNKMAEWKILENLSIDFNNIEPALKEYKRSDDSERALGILVNNEDLLTLMLESLYKNKVELN